MNPEEGSLRPQLLDRFAVAVDIAAPLDAGERRTIVERRIEFERDHARFASVWSVQQQSLREQIIQARTSIAEVGCGPQILARISDAVCAAGVRSLRADLAALRAATAYAALLGESSVRAEHIDAVLPLVLAHRTRAARSQTFPVPTAPPPAQPAIPESQSQESQNEKPLNASHARERIFATSDVEMFPMRAGVENSSLRGTSARAPESQRGPVVRARRTEAPAELDLRASMTDALLQNHALMQTGTAQPQLANLHERVRDPATGTRYVFVIDSSGSHAARERMRRVKGAAANLLRQTFKNGDEVAILVFRGSSAEVVLEPTRTLHEALNCLEYLATGGRTPLAHALQLAQQYLTASATLILLTDGRANVSLAGGDPWQEALEIAHQMNASALVIDTEDSAEPMGRPRELATTLGAAYASLDQPDSFVAMPTAPLSTRWR
jgi:magnesium chelatase subunit D